MQVFSPCRRRTWPGTLWSASSTRGCGTRRRYGTRLAWGRCTTTSTRRRTSDTKSERSVLLVQAKSVTVTPLTVTVAYSDTFRDSQTITKGFQVVRVTNMLLQWHVLGQFQLKMRVKWPRSSLLGIFMSTILPQIIFYTSINALTQKDPYLMHWQTIHGVRGYFWAVWVIIFMGKWAVA